MLVCRRGAVLAERRAHLRCHPPVIERLLLHGRPAAARFSAACAEDSTSVSGQSLGERVKKTSGFTAGVRGQGSERGEPQDVPSCTNVSSCKRMQSKLHQKHIFFLNKHLQKLLL